MVTTNQMPLFADLWKLQEIDSALDTRRASLADAEAGLGETDELIAARERVAELRRSLRSAETSQKDIELEADDLRDKIRPLEEKLYSGRIKNPKELGDLQADIDQLKRQLSSIEDRDLEALSLAEATESELRAAEEELERIETDWQREQAELTERAATLTEEMREYEAERATQAAAIGTDLLRRYENLRERHQGRGVARLDRNLCTGCRISLPTNVVSRARAGSMLVQCPNCERILVA